MRRIALLSLGCTSVLLLSGCFGASAPIDEQNNQESSSASSEDSASLVTGNVNYEGVVMELTGTDRAQATHTLLLASGGDVLLRSTELNLDPYVGRRIEAHGSTELLADANVTLMTVLSVTLLDDASSSSSPMESSSSSISQNTKKFCGGIAGVQCPQGMACVDDPSDSCDPNAGGADCGGMCVQTLESTSSSSSKSTSSKSSIAVNTSSSSSSSSITTSTSQAAQASAMAKQKYDDSLWTQKYCTGYMAFCVPAHKNWYYKSFGATTATLWRVEFGIQTIENVGDGAIVLNLVSGTSTEAGAADGAIKAQGSDIVGYKDWNGKHFEITADSSLRSVAEYMLSHIVSHTPSE